MRNDDDILVFHCIKNCKQLNPYFSFSFVCWSAQSTYNERHGNESTLARLCMRIHVLLSHFSLNWSSFHFHGFHLPERKPEIWRKLENETVNYKIFMHMPILIFWKKTYFACGNWYWNNGINIYCKSGLVQ